MNNIVAVIVTYNRIDMLRQCIQHVQAQTVLCDILIIDNASTDGTEVFVKQLTDARIHYYNIGENLGGAGGFNMGMKLAVERGYDYVWIMDDDCLPKADSLEQLLLADKLLGSKENYGFLSSAVLWTDGSECRMNRQKRVSEPKKEQQKHEAIDLEKIKQATFVSLLIPAKTICRAGLPIKEFFIWGDDIEYTRRIALSEKMPSYLVKRSKVIHAMKNNAGSSIAVDDIERLARYEYAFRNEAFLYRKEGWKGVCYYCAKCGLNIGRIIFKKNNHKAKRLKAIASGMIKGVFFNPKIEYCKQIDNKGSQK